MNSDYLNFIEQHNTGKKTKKYYVYSKSDGTQLGIVTFKSQWRKYIFEPFGGTIFDNVCLSDIAAFIATETQKWRESL